MTATPDTVPARPSFAETLAVYLKPRVLIVLFLGFSAGLPLALSGSTLLVWMTEAGVDLGTIGLFALVGTPYTIKFLWAPVVDALDVPLLRPSARPQKRLADLFPASSDRCHRLPRVLRPGDVTPWLVALGALLVATASATQDIVIDAFRIESLPEDEQAAGMASYVAAYRIGMLASTAGALFLVTGFEGLGFGKTRRLDRRLPRRWRRWSSSASITTLIATEPQNPPPRRPITPRTLARTAVRRSPSPPTARFTDFLTRDAAIVVLVFVVLYKFCDAFAGAMTAPFVIDLGFTRNDYAAIVKVVGLIATLIGGFVGGALALHLSRSSTCLWIGALLQMASNFVFTWQALVGVKVWALTVTIIVENFTGAIGTVIFVAYLSALCNSPLHTATQYALLTALAAVGRTYLSAGAGFVAASARAGRCSSSSAPRPRCRASCCSPGCSSAATSRRSASRR